MCDTYFGRIITLYTIISPWTVIISLPHPNGSGEVKEREVCVWGGGGGGGEEEEEGEREGGREMRKII